LIKFWVSWSKLDQTWSNLDLFDKPNWCKSWFDLSTWIWIWFGFDRVLSWILKQKSYQNRWSSNPKLDQKFWPFGSKVDQNWVKIGLSFKRLVAPRLAKSNQILIKLWSGWIGPNQDSHKNRHTKNQVWDSPAEFQAKSGQTWSKLKPIFL
jgi:hypothetical protein